MNKVYRLIWSAVRQCWIVAAEKVTGKGGIPARTVGALSIAVLLACGTAHALPTDGTVAAGSASISSPSAGQMQITQTSNRAVINWQSFGIAKGESVNITQPSAQAALLNRVVGNSSSEIYGSLTANGQVFLINPNGVLFGKGASVNVGGLVASSLNITDDNFMNNNLKFFKDGTAGSVSNQGSITAGFAALLGPTVDNSGSIVTYKGSTVLGGADAVTLNFDTSGLIALTLDQGAYNAQVQNSGIIEADAGRVILTAKSADSVLKSMVNTSGVIRARSVDTRTGEILLLGDMDNGTVKVGGTLDASAPNDGNGGFIETSAHIVQVADGATITTLAPKGSTGTWLIDPYDFTISSGSGSLTSSSIGAATLASSLASTDVTITTDSSSGSENGDINVNAAVSWSAATILKLKAYNNININADITATSGTLKLHYGQGTTDGSGSGYSLNNGAKVNLSEGEHFYTKQGSDGSVNIWYVITSLGSAGSYTGTDLQGISGSGYYALGTNIDASATSLWSSGFNPIGSSYGGFGGSFDGLGHTISGLVINRGSTDYVGLFNSLGSGSSVANVGLVGGSVTGLDYVGGVAGYNQYGNISNVYTTASVAGHNKVGGLVGYMYRGSISNASSTGNVSGNYEVGGLVGLSYGSISNSYATGSVTGSADVGGLVGYNDGGTISDSYATGNISGTYYVGGLAGYSVGGISTSYATGDVTGSGDYVGGLVGYNFSLAISNSYATGNVAGHNSVGGLVGYNQYGNISNVYAMGSGSGIYKIGGLVGYNDHGSISSSYATGSASGDYQVGGLVGLNEGTVSNSYWDKTTGIATGVGINDGTLTNVVGKTTAQLAAALPTGFSSTVWGNADNQTTPYLLSHTSFSTTSGPVILGSDSSSTPTRYGVILNATQLQNINSTGLSGNYVLGADIDASATSSWNSNGSGGYYGFERIGDFSTAFSGVFNGLGHTISNLYINRSNRHAMGLFGRNSGTITNLGLIDASISVSGTGYDIGGLAGENTGSISNSYVTGSVTGNGDYVGGLAGWNSSSATISNSYTTAVVTGINSVGGLVGLNDGSISNSYAAGDVTGSSTVGGLAGKNNGTISKTYATGDVTGSSTVGGLVGWNNDGTINAGFFDTTTTHQSNGCGYNSSSGTCDVTGKSTYWMQTFNNFYTWGPSISSTGGSSAVWRIYDGYTYPLLRSFLTSLTVRANSSSVSYNGTYVSPTVSYSSSYDSSLLLGTVDVPHTSSKNVGSYTVTPSGLYSTQQGYDISFASGTVTITKVILHILAASNSKTYDGTTSAAATPTIINGALQTGDSLTGLTETYDSKNVLGSGGSILRVSGYTLSDGNSGNNYTVYTFSTHGTITPATLSVSGTTTADNKVYDGTTVASVSGGSLSGVIGSDTVTLSQSGSFLDKNVGAGKTVTVFNSLSGSAAGNYSIAASTTTADITPATLTVSGTITADNKVYDGTTTATVSGGMLSGVISGDTVTLTQSGSFLDKNVGTAKTVTYTNTLSGADAGNYSSSAGGTTTADITPAPLTITATTNSKTYDGSTSAAATPTYSGLQTGDSLTGLTETYASKNVLGAGGSTLGVSGYTLSDGNSGNNYTVVTNSTSGTITPATLTVTGTTTADNKVYDGTTVASVSGGSLSGAISGDAVTLSQSGDFSDKNVGSSKAVTYTDSLSGSDAGNYTLAGAGGSTTADITPAPLTVSANSAVKTYNGSAYSGGNGVSYSGLASGDDASVLSGTLTYSGTSQGASVVGSYVITPGGLSGSNYSISFRDGTLTIRPVNNLNDQLNPLQSWRYSQENNNTSHDQQGTQPVFNNQQQNPLFAQNSNSSNDLIVIVNGGVRR